MILQSNSNAMLHYSLTVCVSFSVHAYVCVSPLQTLQARLCLMCCNIINILDMIIVLLSAIYVIYIAQIVCFLRRIHVGLLQRVGFKAVYLIVQPAIQRLYNAPQRSEIIHAPCNLGIVGACRGRNYASVL